MKIYHIINFIHKAYPSSTIIFKKIYFKVSDPGIEPWTTNNNVLSPIPRPSNWKRIIMHQMLCNIFYLNIYNKTNRFKLPKNIIMNLILTDEFDINENYRNRTLENLYIFTILNYIYIKLWNIYLLT